MDAIFRPAGDAEIAKVAYKERHQGVEEGIQANFVQKRTLFTLAFPVRDSETDRELISDLGAGIVNPDVARIVLVLGPYGTFEQIRRRAS